MEHLSAEALARLVDEQPNVDEFGHLEACADCAREVEELRQQTSALGALPDLRPPPGDWEVLQAKLVSEGLVRTGSRPEGRWRHVPGWGRAAAAILLFAAGAIVGGVTARDPMVANFTGSLPSGMEFPVSQDVDSPEDAAQLVLLAEEQYVDALLRWRQLSGLDEEGAAAPDPAERYAALEYLVRAGRAALRTAPADPFLNGLVASAVDERDAVLRQISSVEENNWY